jgi:hypothetical protein
MASTQRRYDKAELARRGDAIYERRVRAEVTSQDDGKFVAIDVDSGDFDIDVEELAACDRLRSRAPDAQVWLMRIGTPYVHRFGRHE